MAGAAIHFLIQFQSSFQTNKTLSEEAGKQRVDGGRAGRRGLVTLLYYLSNSVSVIYQAHRVVFKDLFFS